MTEKEDNLQNAEQQPITDQNKSVTENENAETTPKEEGKEEKEKPESSKEVITSTEGEETIEDKNHDDGDDAEEEDHHEEETIDYDTLSPEDLMKEATKFINKEPIQSIKRQIDAIKASFYNQLSDERKEKLAEFIEEGGNEIDFEFIQPIKSTFGELMHKYRKARDAYYAELEEKLNTNLKERLSLIDQLKELVNKDESMSTTFDEFKQIQEAWRNCGSIPKAQSSDVWRTYHHHVENFYDYISINRELRDMDFKKNLKQKEELCKKAEALLEESSINKAFKELQKLHKKWKTETGPVAKEFREPIWERFSEATKKLHDKRHEFFKELKEKQQQNLVEKEAVCVSIENIIDKEINSHKAWQNKIKEVAELQDKFKSIGRVPDSDNDRIWQRYRAALSKFNRAKNAFYKEMKDEQRTNLDLKMKLVEEAESLKDSTDWKETANKLKRLQADWKKIGQVPRKDSDKIWKRFRGACNTFFNNLNENFKAQEAELEGNYTKKEELLKEVEALKDADASTLSVDKLKGLISNWKEAGQVPRDKRDIEGKFNKVIDSLFDKLKLGKKETTRIKFKNKLESISAQGDNRQLDKERDFIRRKIDETKKEIIQLETNINFFSSSKGTSPLVKEVEKNIARHKEELETWKSKLKMINEL